jgi:hypothetical protein
MNKYIFILAILLAMFSNFLTFSQDVTNSGSWKLYKEITGLQIFSKELSCNDDQNGIHQQFIIFQFVNSTSEQMNISWQKETWYDEKCTTCDKPANNENTYHLTLEPGESIEATCDKNSPSGLKIFSNFLNTVKGSHLTKFEIKNLSITFK